MLILCGGMKAAKLVVKVNTYVRYLCSVRVKVVKVYSQNLCSVRQSNIYI